MWNIHLVSTIGQGSYFISVKTVTPGDTKNVGMDYIWEHRAVNQELSKRRVFCRIILSVGVSNGEVKKCFSCWLKRATICQNGVQIFSYAKIFVNRSFAIFTARLWPVASQSLCISLITWLIVCWPWWQSMVKVQQMWILDEVKSGSKTQAWRTKVNEDLLLFPSFVTPNIWWDAA